MLHKNSSRIFIYILFICTLPINLQLISQPLFSKSDNNLLFADRNISKKDQLRTIEIRGIGYEIKDAIKDAAVKALQEVAGSFIDSETLYKNNSQVFKNE